MANIMEEMMEKHELMARAAIGAFALAIVIVIVAAMSA